MRTAYLDTSHISEWYQAAMAVGTKPPWTQLDEVDWAVTRLAVSYVLVAELAGMADHRRDAACDWLQAKNPLWVMGHQRLWPLEIEYWTRNALGLRPPASRPIGEAAYALGRRSPPPYRMPDPTGVVQRARRKAFETVQRLGLDRQNASARGHTDEEIVAVTEGKQLNALLAECWQVTGPRFEKNEKAMRRRVSRLFERSPASFPMFRIHRHAITALGFAAEKQDVESHSFEKRHRGTAGDLLHLVAAAHCNVFTCDQRTSDLIGDERLELGLPQQIAGSKEVVLDQLLGALG